MADQSYQPTCHHVPDASGHVQAVWTSFNATLGKFLATIPGHEIREYARTPEDAVDQFIFKYNFFYNLFPERETTRDLP